MADTPMRLDAPKERRGSIPSMFGDPSQRRRGNVLSSADMLGVRRKNSAEGSSSSKGSAPALLLRASTGPLPGRGKDGTFSVAAVAVAAAAHPVIAVALPLPRPRDFAAGRRVTVASATFTPSPPP